MGSGNVGAANAFRVLGKKTGIAVLAIDMAKGWLAVAGLASLCWSAGGEGYLSQAWWKVLAGAAAIAGHNWTPFLKFKGGKGIATSAGVLAALAWPVLASLILVFLVVVALSRYVSLGSMACAVLLPILMVGFGQTTPYVVFAALASASALWKHRSNLNRLLKGEERRITL